MNEFGGNWTVESTSKSYTTKQFAEILDFAQKHAILQYFPEILNRIDTFFPNSSTMIELIQDIEEGYFTIFIRVFTSLSVKEAFEQNRQMYRDWELLKDKNFNQYINISTRSL